MIADTKVAHNGILIKLFSSWRALPFLAYCEINTKYQISFLPNILKWNLSLASSATTFDFLHKDMCLLNCLYSCLFPGAANHHSQSTLRPPLPPPHNHHTLSHQSANSLNRNTLRGGRNPIHAPAPGPGDGPTTPESVQLQDSWVLNSNVPLETRSEMFPFFGFFLQLTGLPDVDV